MEAFTAANLDYGYMRTEEGQGGGFVPVCS